MEWFFRSGIKCERPVTQINKTTAFFIDKKPCSRCGGAGGAEKWNLTGWTCYACGGDGHLGDKIYKVYTVEKLQQLNRLVQKNQLARVAKKLKEKNEKENCERKINSGYTIDEWVQAHNEFNIWKQTVVRNKRKLLLTSLADRISDGRNGFCDSIAETLRNGDLPYGRGLSITKDILAKQAGRYNSKAYNAEYEKIENLFDEVEDI